MENCKRAVVLANGVPPTKTRLTMALGGADLLLCADGGANAAARMGLMPDMIIGDLDSIESETLKSFSQVKTRRIADQSTNDLEKALTWLTRKGYSQIDIFGATGGRLDHTLGNLSGVAKFQRKARITLFDERGEIHPALSEMSLDVPQGTTVSLLPLTLCEGVITTGLKWNLRYESLGMGLRDGTSNVVVASPASVKVRRGTMFVFVKAEAD